MDEERLVWRQSEYGMQLPANMREQLMGDFDSLRSSICATSPKSNVPDLQGRPKNCIPQDLPPAMQLAGLYESEIIGTGENASRQYLRFYRDGTVLQAGISGNGDADEIAKILKWFHDPYSSSGTYLLQGSAIRFSITSPQGVVAYEGTVQGTVVSLDSISYINAYRGHYVLHLIASSPGH
jgi:hypothetical protein